MDAVPLQVDHFFNAGLAEEVVASPHFSLEAQGLKQLTQVIEAD